MKIVEEKITPKRAQELLSTASDQRQRHLSVPRVKKFALAMKAGSWRLTHQPIAVDAHGVLIDGQHRMAAVVQSGVTCSFLVAYESEASTFDVIDTGQARTAADSLAIAGYTNVNVLAASVRLLLTYPSIVGTKSNLSSAGRNVTTAQIIDYLESERGSVVPHAAVEADAIARMWGRYGAKTWLTAAVTLALQSGLNRDVLAEFLSKLRNGDMLAAGSPILAMRRWVMSDGGWISNPAGERQTMGIAVFIKTLNGWLAREHRNLALFRVGMEFMPEITLPEGFVRDQVYGDDERIPLEIEEDAAARELEEASA